MKNSVYRHLKIKCIDRFYSQKTSSKSFFQGLFVIFLMIFNGQSVYAGGGDDASVELIITSGIVEHSKPKNHLKTVSKADKKFYIFMQWHNLPVEKKWLVCNVSEPVGYKTDIYDGNNRLVKSDIHAVSPSHPEAVSWMQHNFKPEDAPGTWRIEHYTLNVMFSTTFEVTP